MRRLFNVQYFYVDDYFPYKITIRGKSEIKSIGDPVKKKNVEEQRSHKCNMVQDLELFHDLIVGNFNSVENQYSLIYYH